MNKLLTKFFLIFPFVVAGCTHPDRKPSAYEGQTLETNSIVISKGTGELLVSINENDFRDCSVVLTKVGSRKFECVLTTSLVKAGTQLKMISATSDFTMYENKGHDQNLTVHLRPDHLKVEIQADTLQMARALLQDEVPKNMHKLRMVRYKLNEGQP